MSPKVDNINKSITLLSQWNQIKQRWGEIKTKVGVSVMQSIHLVYITCVISVGQMFILK